MRIALPFIAACLTAAGWTAVAHAQADATRAATTTEASTPALASSSGVGSLSTTQRRHADRALQRRVGAALARAPELNATRLLVRARDGNVTLAGSVTDTGQAERAAAVARQVDGVVSVSNQLRIDGPGL
jgi:hyperosmotically inducible periplasmic protein